MARLIAADSGANRSSRVLLLGATGTIGRAVARELFARGTAIVCLVRPGSGGAHLKRILPDLPAESIRFGEAGDPACLDAILRGGGFSAIVSCIASRTGVPDEAWAVDYRANLTALRAAQSAGVPRMVLLSALCVQRPRLAFQHAKLAMEAELIASGLAFSIVRPTAFFKSLSGQFDRVRAGKPFLVFGDGTGTATKPIGDVDLARFIADCLDDPGKENRILPIGGPGPAITPRQQGEFLSALFGRPPRFRQVPPRLLQFIAHGLDLAARLDPAQARKAELARIGHYYATQSMLVLDPETGRFDADATPSTGTQTLFAHYERLLRGAADADRGAHAVFRSRPQRAR